MTHEWSVYVNFYMLSYYFAYHCIISTENFA